MPLPTARLLFVSFLFYGNALAAQVNPDSLIAKINPEKYADAISSKADKLEGKLTAKSMAVLNKFQKQEEKLFKKMLSGKDSAAARLQLSAIQDKYVSLKDQLRSGKISSAAKTYLPKLDSLSTSLKLLKDLNYGDKVKAALSKTESLQDKFHQAEQIRKFIKERKEFLKQQFENLGMVRDLKRINKQAYYYSAQLKEYKAILNDPRKIEKKALELLSKTTIFKKFMEKHSMLASLFRMPGDASDPAYMASLAGLQTRAQVGSLIEQRIQAGGPGAREQLQRNLQAAQSELQSLKNKLKSYGSGNSDDILPEGFKPNEEKTKSFLKRIEYSTNIQSQKANGYFPVTSDIAMTAGYKLNEKSVVGVGLAYKMGLGRGLEHIRFSHQGLGFRSFIDWKLKGSFWISGGFEMNYMSAFNSIRELQQLHISSWQRSGLIGLSKTVPIKAKFFKKTKVQLLWDFLSYEQRPQRQAIVYRIGYNF